MNPYPHNTMNFIPPNNAFYDNVFSQNNIDNGLFSYNVENKNNQDKKRLKKPEESDGSNAIILDDVNFIYKYYYFSSTFLNFFKKI